MSKKRPQDSSLFLKSSKKNDSAQKKHKNRNENEILNSSSRKTHKCDTNIRADIKNAKDRFGGRRRRRFDRYFWRTIMGQYETTSGQQGKSSIFEPDLRFVN